MPQVIRFNTAKEIGQDHIFDRETAQRIEQATGYMVTEFGSQSRVDGSISFLFDVKSLAKAKEERKEELVKFINTAITEIPKFKHRA